MNQKLFLIAMIFLTLHGIFLALTYSPDFLSSFGNFLDPLLVHRLFMLLQFSPLLLVIGSRILSKNKGLMFLTFAICISTLYAIGDFGLGFYGATIDYSSGLFPRMRVPTTLMAYRDTGRLVFVDYHAEYFLESILVYFISNITGINSIFAYVFIVRAIAIAVWSLLFVWSTTFVSGHRWRLWVLLLASSMLLANQGYNDETSFGPILFVFSYLALRKQMTSTQSRGFVGVTFMAIIGTLFASFRETQLWGLVSLVTLCLIPFNKRSMDLQSRLLTPRTSINALILLLVSTRVFLFTSQEYFGGYIHRVSAIIHELWATLTGSWTLKQLPLGTFERIRNPLDYSIGLLAVIFALGLFALLGIFSVSFILKRRRLGSFSLAIVIAFIVALAVPVSAYITQKFTGSGAIYDYATATFLPRSLAPLAVLTIISYSQKMRIRHLNGKRIKFLIIFAMIYLSMTLIFAPFMFYRKDIKSSYDMQRVFGDTSDFVVLGNNEYEFVLSHLPVQSQIVILSPASGYLQLFLALPLHYQTGKQIIQKELGTTAPMLTGRVFDNGLFTVGVYRDSVSLDELPLFD